MLSKTIWLYYDTKNLCWVAEYARYYQFKNNVKYNSHRYFLSFKRTWIIRDLMYEMARQRKCDMPNAILAADGSVMLCVTVQ